MNFNEDSDRMCPSHHGDRFILDYTAEHTRRYGLHWHSRENVKCRLRTFITDTVSIKF